MTIKRVREKAFCILTCTVYAKAFFFFIPFIDNNKNPNEFKITLSLFAAGGDGYSCQLDLITVPQGSLLCDQVICIPTLQMPILSCPQ